MTSKTTTRARTILSLASIGVALAAADTYVVVLALTEMMNGVGLTIDALHKATPIISGFLLGYIAVLPLVGRIADLVSRQRVLQVCLAVFIVGSIFTALASDLTTLVGGRVIQGVGGGGLVPATLALVADLWPADKRGVPLGVVGAVQELGSVLGPVLGAAILAIAQWRAIFWFNALVGALLAIALALAARRLPAKDATTPPPKRAPMLVLAFGLVLMFLALWAPPALTRHVVWGAPFMPLASTTTTLVTPIGLVALAVTALGLVLALLNARPVLRQADVPGALLLGAALGCVILTFASANPETEVIGPLGYALLPFAALFAAAYVWRHATASEPLIPRGVLRARVPWTLVVSLLVGVALVAVIVAVPLLSRLTVSPSETDAAFELLKFLIAVPVGAIVGGWLLRILADGTVAGTGLALAALMLLLASNWGADSLETLSATVVLVLMGLGIGLALAPVNNAALADAPESTHATASSLVVVARMMGMVVGLALLTGIGLNRFYATVAELPPNPDADALLAAAITQVQVMLFGASIAAALAALACIALGLVRRNYNVEVTSAILPG
jgi:MFS family permease